MFKNNKKKDGFNFLNNIFYLHLGFLRILINVRVGITE